MEDSCRIMAKATALVSNKLDIVAFANLNPIKNHGSCQFRDIK